MSNFGLVVAHTENLGDDIQSLSVLQYLSEVDEVIDRDKPRAELHVKVIFNGWYTHEPWNWLPGPSITPLFISMHIAPFAYPILLSRSAVKRVFMQYGPVGARDLFTLGVLRSYGIPTYFSGCLTLTLDYGFKSAKRKQGYVLVIDIPESLAVAGGETELRYASQALHKTPIDYIGLLPGAVRKIFRELIPYALIDNINFRLQRISARKLEIITRLIKASQRVAEIAGASLVVTSRLHVALPALAFDVPVVFVHENLRDPRFWGLTDFMNVYTPKRFRDLMEGGRLDPKDFGIPKYERLQELKTQLVERVKEFVREE